MSPVYFRPCPKQCFAQRWHEVAPRRTLDSLSANKSLAALEQFEWEQRRDADDILASKVASIYFWCVHHQACLAKKPALLGIPGLCSSLVRQCHTFRSSTFRQDFYNAVTAFIRTVPRVEVLEIPEEGGWRARNREILDLCSADLGANEKEKILEMFNNDWVSNEVKHFCLPGCCSSRKHFHERFKQAAILAWGIFPDVPLLYRWKGFEEACSYTMRGIAMHRCLARIYKQVYDKKNAKTYEEILSWDQGERDGAEELSPSERQQLRMVKTICMLQRPNLFPELCQAMMVARPLASFMNTASGLEACRQRLVLLKKGLSLPTWKGPRTEMEIMQLSWNILSGGLGLQSLEEYTDILVAPSNAAVWCPWMTGDRRLNFGECLVPLIACACETWKRLVFRFECCPFEILGLVSRRCLCLPCPVTYLQLSTYNYSQRLLMS